MRSDVVANLNNKLPVGIKERLMTLNFPLKGCNLQIISAYTNTMTQSQVDRVQFYDAQDLNLSFRGQNADF